MKIFISHSSQDKWVARQISKLLESENHQTFIDEKDIKTGDSIDAQIQKHLATSDQLLILLSPASLSSHWVFIELGGAKALGIKVIPILFHVGANEIPQAISQLLARDINEMDKYLLELKSTKSQKTATKSDTTTKHSVGGYSVGDKVKILFVENLSHEERQVFPKWVKEMDKYAGMGTRIVGFSIKGNAFLEIDNKKYRWNLLWISKIP